MEKIKVGVSSCLLGNEVRYNGGHKLNSFIRDSLGKWCDFIPVCPEVGCGLSIPRESMHLEGSPENPRLVTTKSGADHTQRMNRWIEQELLRLEKENLVAFIFKSKSPSSGMAKIKVFNESGKIVSYNGVGLFAKAFMERFPLLPVEDEGRLSDPVIRENFVETLFVLQRWREAMDRQTSSALVEFHSCHKYSFMAHSNVLLKKMGKIIARSGSMEFQDLTQTYGRLLIDLLKDKKNSKKNCNVLQHMMGYFKKELSAGEKRELLRGIHNYRKGLVPLLVPLTLIGHYTEKYNKTYLLKQHYLNPHPLEMKLLNSL